MKRIALTAFCLLTISLAWQLLGQSPAGAQIPSGNPRADNEAPDLFAPNQSPFGSDPSNAIPPNSPLRTAPGNDPVAPAPPPGDPSRDPTMVAPDIRNLLDPPTDVPNREQLPVPRLSGRVSLASGKTMAVIEISGNFWIVEEGDRIDFSVGNRGVETLRIVTLSASRVEVKFDEEEQTFQLR